MRCGEAGFRVRKASGSPTYLLRPRATHQNSNHKDHETVVKKDKRVSLWSQIGANFAARGRRGPHTSSCGDFLCKRPPRTRPHPALHCKGSQTCLERWRGRGCVPAAWVEAGGVSWCVSGVPAARPWSGDTADVRKAQRQLGRTGTALASDPVSRTARLRLLQDVPDNHGLSRKRVLSHARRSNRRPRPCCQAACLPLAVRWYRDPNEPHAGAAGALLGS